MGDCIGLMNRAIQLINEDIGKIVSKSGIYCSKSWGYISTRDYYNQCIVTHTELNPNQVLETILKIESKLGRVRKTDAYADREIDIDILFYANRIISDEKLTIPHPRMHLRRFALLPVNEVDPGFVHPVFKKRISMLLAECIDESVVKLYKDLC